MKYLIAVLLVLALGIGGYLLLRQAPEPSSSPAPSPPPSSSAAAPESSLSSHASTAPSSPQSAVEELLDSVKELDVATVQALLTDAAGLGNLDEQTRELLQPFAQRVSWEVGKAEIQEDTAAVEVSVTAPELSGVMSALSVEAVKYTAAQAMQGKTPDYEAFARDYLKNKVDWEKLPLKTTEASVHLQRDGDGVWKIDNKNAENRELIDALTGGALETLQNLQSLVKK